MKVNRASRPLAVVIALLVLLFALPALAEQHTEDMQTETFAEGTQNRWGYVDVKGGVNLRRKANTRSTLAGKIKNGVMVFVYEAAGDDDGEWLVVDHNGSKVYVLAEYIKILTAESSLKYNNTLKNPMPTPAPSETPEPQPAATPAPMTGGDDAENLPEATAETEPEEPESLGNEGEGDETPDEGYGDEDYTQAEPANDDEPVGGDEPVGNVLDLSDGGDEDEPEEEPSELVEGSSPEKTEPAVISAQLPTEKMDAVALAVLNGLPVRNNPMQYAAITGYLSEGDPVRVTAEVTGEDGKVWYAVSYKGVWGYVASELLAFVSDTAPYAGALASANVEPLMYDVTRDSIFGYVTSASLLMRSEPDAAADNGITRLAKDALGMIVSYDDTWAEIVSGENEGYVSVKYFKPYTLGEVSNLLSNKEFADAIAAFPIPEDVIAQ
ncbi:MAG: SH3 domain-containing protein [Eubacteriales bacterium]|nr:SH3 domain-containing protein [Eubacteriales bacterium]MDD3881589.1 SH3 domain-containing protein [Eubacteriales bacterium]MDD4512352.1 SH3 domain-containing protein [Eubacteriales bacterium]